MVALSPRDPWDTCWSVAYDKTISYVGNIDEAPVSTFIAGDDDDDDDEVEEEEDDDDDNVIFPRV